MKEYSLRIIAEGRINSPDEIIVSNNMISYMLTTEFAKLSHVKLFYHEDSPWSSNQIYHGAPAKENQQTIEQWQESLKSMDIVDFTLMHCYTNSIIFRELDTLRNKTKYQIMGISEMPNFDADYWFTFLYSQWKNGNCEQVVLPAYKALLNESLSGVSKLPGSILLDHEIPVDYNWGPFYAN